ncbi:MAG: potassium channel family protein [Chloroflexota bacterium]|nr:two pore domain potassium channel family protein [Anaerolineales bacterium]
MPGVGFFLFLWRFMRAIVDGLKDAQFRGLLTSVILILLTGMMVYHHLEGWSWLDSLYFCVITLTTVGYGDFSPQTSGGKIFTMIYLVIGLGVLSSFIVLVAERQLDSRVRLLPRRDNVAQASPKEGEKPT